MPSSAAQRRREAEAAYRDAVKSAYANWAADEQRYLKALRSHITDYRNQLLADLPPDGEWAAHRRQAVIDMLDDARTRLDAALSREFAATSDRAIDLAMAGVDAPLSAFGVNVANVSRQIPLDQIGLIQRVAPTLIANVTSQVHGDVQMLIQRYMSGGIPRQDVLRKIGAATGPLRGGDLKPGQIIPRAEVRARAIFTTEINRVSSLTQAERTQQLAEHDPGVGSRWVHFHSMNPRPTHVALHGTTIFPAHGERFELGGARVLGPHAPELGAADVVFCHCKTVTVYDPTRSAKDVDPIIATSPSGAGSVAATPSPPAPKPKRAPKPKPAPTTSEPDAGRP